MKTNNKRCKYCNRILSTDPKSISYTPNLDFDYCLRCWNLVHYNLHTNNELANQISLKNVEAEKIDSNSSVIFLINDILDIDLELIKKFKNYHKVYYVFNKLDLVLNNRNYDLIYGNLVLFLKRQDIKEPKLILSSSKSNYGIRTINDLLIHQPLKIKSYFIGNTNAGKTSLINKVLKFNNSRKQFVVSSFLNTTIDFHKAKINMHSIIDCPGSNFKSNILYALDPNQNLNKILNIKKAKSYFYQIKKPSGFYFDKFLSIAIIPKSNCSVSFFFNLNVDLNRSQIDKLDSNLSLYNSNYNFIVNEYKTVNLKSKYDIFTIQIRGMGHIVIRNTKSIFMKVVNKDTQVDVIEGRIW